MVRDFRLNMPNPAKQEATAKGVVFLPHYTHSYLNTLTVSPSTGLNIQVAAVQIFDPDEK